MFKSRYVPVLTWIFLFFTVLTVSSDLKDHTGGWDDMVLSCVAFFVAYVMEKSATEDYKFNPTSVRRDPFEYLTSIHDGLLSFVMGVMFAAPVIIYGSRLNIAITLILGWFGVRTAIRLWDLLKAQKEWTIDV